MISLLQYIYNWLEPKEQKDALRGQFEHNANKFEAEVEQELAGKRHMEMKNSVSWSKPLRNIPSLEEDYQSDECYERQGVVTELWGNNGIIDDHLYFYIKVAGSLAPQLSKGCQVKYLAYHSERNENTKVMKIKEVADNFNWDDELLPNERKLDDKKLELQLQQPKYFPVHQRNILGLVVEREPKGIVVDTDEEVMTVCLDELLEIDFEPHPGDCLSIYCIVQSDDDFVGCRGEILQPVRVQPARIIKQEKRTVKDLFTDWGALSDKSYFTFDILTVRHWLKVGDIVSCDLIECQRGAYIWRCIKLSAWDSVNITNPKKAAENEADNREVRRYMRMSARQYANQVWSKKNEIIPGVRAFTKRRFVSTKMGPYEVPERLRQAYFASGSRNEMEKTVESWFPELTKELDMRNYAKRFDALIFLEEAEQYLQIRQYDCERAHFTRDGEYLSLMIKNLSERRPSLVLGDTVRIVNPWTKTVNRCFEGAIHKVLFDRILVKFNDGFQSSYSGEDYRVEFQFSRFSFRKRHHAVNQITEKLGDRFLFPSRISLRELPQLNAELDSTDNLHVGATRCEWFNRNLNSVQKRAVTNVLRGEVYSMPYVIFGPPGTGKTVTLIEIILQLMKKMPSARLVVATPSNSSADLLAVRLIESKQLHPGDFVRLVSYNQIDKELIPENLMPYCATVDMGRDGTCGDTMVTTESGLKLRCQMKFLGRHRLTIGTCNTIGNFLLMGFPPEHFTHVIIDEAGQCTEPDAMMPICLASKTRGHIILAGDPQQLPAIVSNPYAAKRGYSISFLERILQCPPYLKDRLRFSHTSGFDPQLVTKLLYNYRSLPSILNMFSELFYESELLAMVNEKNSQEIELLRKLGELLPPSNVRPESHGVFFHGLRGENKQEPDSPSWYNPTEARSVFLMTIKMYRRGIQPERIGIIAPYAKQVKHLHALFLEAEIDMPKIGSVEEFQGQERDIIIVSTVRSCPQFIASDLRHSMGFVRSEKRMNVAISRARSLLYVYGNPDLLSIDENWRAFIKYCVKNEAYLGCDLPATFNLQ